MPDRKKVIEGLEKCKRCECDDCTEKGASHAPWDCPAYDNFVENAITLLKEQETNKPKIGHWIFESQYYEAWSHTCSECGKRTTTKVNEFANWCWNCGAKMGGEME